MESERDHELERIKNRKVAAIFRERREREKRAQVPRGVVHVGSCDAFARIFSSFPEVPVFVYAWASWCHPCKQAGPLYEKVAASFPGQAIFLKLETDSTACAEFSKRYDVMAVPSFLALKNWRVVGRLTGLPRPGELLAFVRQHLS
ncbi:MAG: hypothetical protein Kow0069_09500 [Promethearchaeota archaeon]